MSVTLRPARALDAGAVGAILSGFIDDTPWMPRIHTRAEDLAHCADLIDRDWVTIAERGGSVVGFLARDARDVHALYIAPPHQNVGVGRDLIEDAKARTDTLRLWTFQANAGAQRFYKRAGFSEVARTTGAANDEGLPDIQYIWERRT